MELLPFEYRKLFYYFYIIIPEQENNIFNCKRDRKNLANTPHCGILRTRLDFRINWTRNSLRRACVTTGYASKFVLTPRIKASL